MSNWTAWRPWWLTYWTRHTPCSGGVGQAMGIPAAPPLAQRRYRREGVGPPGSQPDPEGGASSCARCRDRDTCHMSYLPAFVRHPSAGAGAYGGGQPQRPSVTGRTVIGGSAHQTRKGSDLCKLHCSAGTLKDASRKRPLHRRQKWGLSTSYADPPIQR